MNYSGNLIETIGEPYDGVAVEIYVSGCFRDCEGCHNPELQNYTYGQHLDIHELIDELKQRENWFDIISILGGDLLCRPEPQGYGLINGLKKNFLEKKFWLFTGEDFENLPKWVKDKFDVIKCGKYIKDLHQEGFPASSNQKVYRKGVDFEI